jgi:hypothetical protein
MMKESHICEKAKKAPGAQVANEHTKTQCSKELTAISFGKFFQ